MTSHDRYMKTEVNQLAALQYKPFEELAHARLIEFTRANSKPDSVVSIGYWLCNAIIVGYLIFLLFNRITHQFLKCFLSLA